MDTSIFHFKNRGFANIPFIKYWGKKKDQVPLNSSLSMTINKCYTDTEMFFYKKSSLEKPLMYFFENKQNEHFEEKINQYLSKIKKYIPQINEYDILIKSINSFPHSIGVASSASFYCSLALCITEFLFKIKKNGNIDFAKQASFFARLGSGSASRSVYDGLVLWGKTNYIKSSSNKYAIKLNISKNIFLKELEDFILISDKQIKRVSSTRGHILMDNNPYANTRYNQAQKNLNTILNSIESNDKKTFFEILKKETYSLHAMMMLSNPPYLLFNDKAITMINMIDDFIIKKNIFCGYTLDAGSTIHLIYSKKDKKKINILISDLSKFCTKIINSGLGKVNNLQ